MNIKNVAVIGAGTMGNGIAHVFAQNGFHVNLIDVSESQLQKAIATIGKNLDRLVSKSLLTDKQKEETLKNIHTQTSIENGVKDCELIIEAATENKDLKLKVFKKLDERLVHYLKRKYKTTGSSLISLSPEQIANELATSRVVISRLLKKQRMIKTVALSQSI